MCVSCFDYNLLYRVPFIIIVLSFTTGLKLHVLTYPTHMYKYNTSSLVTDIPLTEKEVQWLHTHLPPLRSEFKSRAIFYNKTSIFSN